MSERARRLSWAWLVVLLPFGWLVHRFLHLIDDAYISFRYAHHLAEGIGLRYNFDGVPVEGFSNPLWVVVLAAAEGLGVPPTFSSLVLGVACSVTLLFVFQRFATRVAGLPWFATFGGVLFLGTFPPFAVWTTSGLETSAFTLALFLTWSELARPEGFRPVRAVLFAIALTTLRPEGFLWALGLFAATWFSARERRERIGRLKRYVPPLVAALGLLLLARYLYFGELLPNTVRAKGSLTEEALLRGWRCLASYFLVLLSPALVLLLAPLSLRGGRLRSTGSALVVTLAGFGWCVFVGGDWMAFFRFLAPFTPFLALLLAGALASLPRVVGAVVAAGAVALSLLPAFDRNLVPRELLGSLDFRAFRSGFTTESERFALSERNQEQFLLTGRALGEIAKREDSLTFGAIGAIGYYSDMTILDRNGLVDREVAGLEVTELRSAGHDKRVPRSFFRPRKPTYYDAVFIEEQTGEAAALRLVANRMRRALGEDPEERALFECSVPELIPITGDGENLPRGWLGVWRGTESVAEAYEGWDELGLP